MKIAFIVDEFPVITQTFLINQVADMIDKGIDVDIFSFKQGSKNNISERFFKYDMEKRCYYLEAPDAKFEKIIKAVPNVLKLLLYKPQIIFEVLKNGGRTRLLKILFQIGPFLGKHYDLFHCHFGPTANKFLVIKDILGFDAKIVTSFYGYDASLIFREKPKNYYDKLKKESSLFFVMSENMRERMIEKGFSADKIRVLPVSIDVDLYQFCERKYTEGEIIKIVSVGRFVEKKGFDDLIRALAILKNKNKIGFKCTIVGDGPLKTEIFKMIENLKLEDLIEFKGYMKLEDILKLFYEMHLFVQPSKTALNGDME